MSDRPNPYAPPPEEDPRHDPANEAGTPPQESELDWFEDETEPLDPEVANAAPDPLGTSFRLEDLEVEESDAAIPLADEVIDEEEAPLGILPAFGAEEPVSTAIPFDSEDEIELPMAEAIEEATFYPISESRLTEEPSADQNAAMLPEDDAAEPAGGEDGSSVLDILIGDVEDDDEIPRASSSDVPLLPGDGTGESTNVGSQTPAQSAGAFASADDVDEAQVPLLDDDSSSPSGVDLSNQDAFEAYAEDASTIRESHESDALLEEDATFPTAEELSRDSTALFDPDAPVRTEEADFLINDAEDPLLHEELDDLILDQPLEDIEKEISGGGAREQGEEFYAIANDEEDALQNAELSLSSTEESSAVDLGADWDAPVPDSARPISPESVIIRSETDYDEGFGVKDDTSEQQIIPTVGIDENGDPISATDLPPVAFDPTSSTPTQAKRGLASPALVGLLVGLLLGAGALAGGLWVAGVYPPETDSTRPVVTIPNGTTADPGTPTPTQAAVAGPEAGYLALQMGNPAEALKQFNQVAPPTPAILAGRGQAHWLLYLQQQSAASEAIDPSAPDVVQARQALQEAVAQGKQSAVPEVLQQAAVAQLWLGLIDETVANPEAARTIFQQGRDDFPQQRALFDTALKRLEALQPDTANLQSHWHPRDAWLGFTVLLVVQAPMTPTSPLELEPAAPFWDALLAARQHDYAAAREALRNARERHEQQRKQQLGQHLSPLSDPLQQAFLRCCDELNQYWALREMLYLQPDAPQLVQAEGIPGLVRRILDERQQTRELLEAAAAKLKPVMLDEQALPLAIDKLIAARQQRDSQLLALAKQLQAAGYKDLKLESALAKALANETILQDKLKALAAQLAKAGYNNAEPTKALQQLLQTQRKQVQTLDRVASSLQEAGFMPSKDDQTGLVTGLQEALLQAKSPSKVDLLPLGPSVVVGPTLALAQAMGITDRLRAAQQKIQALNLTIAEEANKFQDMLAQAKANATAEQKAQQANYERMLAQVRGPAKLLDLWWVILSDPNRSEQAPAALADAKTVLANAGAKPEDQAKALAVVGLAQRATNDYASARTTLAKCQQHPGFAPQAGWGRAVMQAQQGLESATPLLAHIDRLAADPTASTQVMAAFETGLRIFPTDSLPREHARVLARRAEWLLPTDPAAAQHDAQQAVQLGNQVTGKLVLARLAETSGNWPEAGKQYRQILASDLNDAAILRQARLGLARALLYGRGRVRSGLELQSQRRTPTSKPNNPFDPLLLSLTMLAVQPLADWPTPPVHLKAADLLPSTQEALELANNLIAQGEYRGYFIRAGVLLQQKQYTAALKEFALGLQRVGKTTSDEAALLQTILDNHPALKRPDPTPKPDRKAALRYFSQGLAFYYACQYVQAEYAFLRAIDANNQDARFLYFLGMSRWMLGNQGAALDNFQTAADLERRGKPVSSLVDQSLERVQGPMRSMLKRYRP